MSPTLYHAISGFVREEYLGAWLEAPNKLLDGKTPAELLRDGQEEIILKAIEKARTGEGS